MRIFIILAIWGIFFSGTFSPIMAQNVPEKTRQQIAFGKHLGEAQSLFQQGERRQILPHLKIAERYLNVAPKGLKFEYHSLYGTYHTQMGNRDAALLHYKNYMTLTPDDKFKLSSDDKKIMSFITKLEKLPSTKIYTPLITQRFPPKYPMQCHSLHRTTGLSYHVTIAYNRSKQGLVRDITIFASDEKCFEDAVLNAIRSWGLSDNYVAPKASRDTSACNALSDRTYCTNFRFDPPPS